MVEPTIFTKIINKQIPATIILETEQFIVIKDINPQAPVHALVISKTAYPTLEAVEDNKDTFVTELFDTIHQAVRKLTISDNYKLHMNVGHQVQEVPHFHCHILGGWAKGESTSVMV